MKTGDCVQSRQQLQNSFDGTAYYYLKYRGHYSDDLIRLLAESCGLNGKGRLLDLGCGTGKLTFPLARYFEESVGIDVSQDMVQKARSQAELLGMKNLKWIRMRSEELTEDFGSFHLITAGDAFHWMEREKVLQLCYDRLVPGGTLALVDQSHLLGDCALPWQQTVREVIARWFGTETAEPLQFGETHERLLVRSSFSGIRSGRIKTMRKRDIHSIIGYLYSTSRCHKTFLGEKAPLFEKDLSTRLRALNPEGIFEEPVKEYYILANKPRKSAIGEK
ncbi:MAG: class I SAM-dependent methyltransferase [Sporolactobacillus sp.]